MGRYNKLGPERIRLVKQLAESGASPAAIIKEVGISRSRVYAILAGDYDALLAADDAAMAANPVAGFTTTPCNAPDNADGAAQLAEPAEEPQAVTDDLTEFDIDTELEELPEDEPISEALPIKVQVRRTLRLDTHRT